MRHNEPGTLRHVKTIDQGAIEQYEQKASTPRCDWEGDGSECFRLGGAPIGARPASGKKRATGTRISDSLIGLVDHLRLIASIVRLIISA